MMNGRHAGQGMPPDGGRRRNYNTHQHQQQMHPQQQYPPQMYNGYMQQPYGAYNYPQHIPQYHTVAPVPQQYQSYQHYARSPPPPMQHYGPAPVPHPSQAYSRPHQSPAISSPYQAPPPPPSEQAPSSTHSSYATPAPPTPPAPEVALAAPLSPPVLETTRMPFRPAVRFLSTYTYSADSPKLPWISDPDYEWPARKPRRKRRLGPEIESVELPEIPHAPNGETQTQVEKPVVEAPPAITIPQSDTPSPSQPASEVADSTHPTTPSSTQPKTDPVAGDVTPTAKPTAKVAIPAVPIISSIPKSSPRDERTQPAAVKPQETEATRAPVAPESTETPVSEVIAEEITEAAPVPKLPAWSTPKAWSGVFKSSGANTSTVPRENGVAAAGPLLGKVSAESLSEALRSFSATNIDSKVAFLEPRGLVNTGNMCYMNSVLQVLVFCFPFYAFLDQVSKRSGHSFKSETPILDAMIMFMREYPVIDSAASVEKLRMRLKDGELEQYGEAFTPDFVYNVINRLPRFSSMRRGHQQDAEEFLGFLLEGLHDECVQVMRGTTTDNSGAPTPTNGASSPISEAGSVPSSAVGKENGWLEVGPKQKASTTRSSGTIAIGSPVTKIFGGNLRSELRVPGMRDSVTLEPYQPLQLDIGAPNVNNIIDALKGLTRSESVRGDFGSPKGPDVTATKQLFIETLPPVLILHLKRFQYNNAGGTQKIWKKVGYPLELEIPKEVFPRQKRAALLISGLPKYRLIAAVYHHGMNASGGHYTVDVRRQDGHEWIRLDDTIIRRVRSEEVAEAGSEEDPKVLAAAQKEKKDTPVNGNGFAAIDGADDDGDEDGWKQASGPGKKWSSVVNGAPASTKPKFDKSSAKDNKVAYLLFYQRI